MKPSKIDGCSITFRMVEGTDKTRANLNYAKQICMKNRKHFEMGWEVF